MMDPFLLIKEKNCCQSWTPSGKIFWIRSAHEVNPDQLASEVSVSALKFFIYFFLQTVQILMKCHLTYAAFHQGLHC